MGRGPAPARCGMRPFVTMYLWKEAVAPSQIEGTRTLSRGLRARRLRDRATSLRECADVAAIVQRDRQRRDGLGRTTGNARQAHPHPQHHEVVSGPDAVEALPISAPTLQKAVDAMERFGIVRETTGEERNGVRVDGECLETLSEETQGRPPHAAAERAHPRSVTTGPPARDAAFTRGTRHRPTGGRVRRIDQRPAVASAV